MSSESTTNRIVAVKECTVARLLNWAKTIEFTCKLSTAEQCSSRKVTLTLSHVPGDYAEDFWHLTGYPLTDAKSQKHPYIEQFCVDNPAQLLLALAADLFPQTFSISLSYAEYTIALYILSVETAVVKECFEDLSEC